jgi:hypothetical protein
MKLEWRKIEKSIYLPKKKPEIIDIPEFQFLTIEGEGRPGSEYFNECISALYSLSYALKMTLKKIDQIPDDYIDYTVYPLEGIWDLNEKGRRNYNGHIDKNDLVYKLMIRQPDFISESYFQQILQMTMEKKPHPLLEKVKFENIRDGKCIQMLHVGSYDTEAVSFNIMEEFTEEQNLKRESKDHREIYLSDFRKVPVEKLKTVLRFKVQDAINR